MKKIIPFKKEIIFNTNLAEITSISLEHHLDIKEQSVIGTFDIIGTYKMNLSSTTTENFNYELPFEIALDERYILDCAIIDIDDFYYEVVNDRVLSIHIEVSIDNLEEKIIEKEEQIVEIEERNNNIEQTSNNLEIERCIEEENPISSVLSSNEIETYKSYTVYIVRENDTVEGILMKYNITKEELEIYNDLEELKIGDKLIIPNV